VRYAIWFVVIDEADSLSSAYCVEKLGFQFADGRLWEL
jgi:hypothetical protein